MYYNIRNKGMEVKKIGEIKFYLSKGHGMLREEKGKKRSMQYLSGNCKYRLRPPLINGKLPANKIKL
jgi:hypothetical protein